MFSKRFYNILIVSPVLTKLGGVLYVLMIINGARFLVWSCKRIILRVVIEYS
jgi:hypothetical protein